MKSIAKRLDAIYSWTERLMKEGRVREIDAVLGGMKTDDVNVLLGFLTATLPMKSRLVSRRRVYDMAKKRLAVLGEDDPTILAGLEAV